MSLRLPPMNAIRAFEGVARRGSILGASEELRVVRGAVRQQITVLEEYFGVALFVRDGRRLVLTERGRAFAASVSSALAIIHRAAAEVEAEEPRRRIRLGVPSAFAVWWLMPRLSALEAAMPEVDVHIVPMPVVEPLSKRPDLDAVLMGAEYRASPEIAATRIMEDEFGPVATPPMAARLGLSAGPSALSGATALSSRTTPSLWSDWFAESATPPVSFARQSDFEDLLLAIGAARSGYGVVVAPRAAIEGDLAEAILVAPDGFIARPAGYHFCYRRTGALDQTLAALGTWLKGAAAAGIGEIS